ncbi:odorant receptor 98a-like [Drosophila willistoni]|uniref:odorant receptor 98a-like n=1 Tax=Drosophila willistoni TaxID=7260 RepID=UPI001F079335|nr:odorant receptor 98a-like [Drosophila willistoni]
MIFELLRKPGPQDMKSSTDAFTYFEYGMTAVGWLPPSRGRKLYLMFRGLVIIWCIVYLPFGMIMGCVKDIKDYKPGEFLTLLETVLNDAGCSLKILALYLYLPKYEKTKNLLERLDEFCVNKADRHTIRYWVTRCNVIFIIYSFLYYGYFVLSFLNGALHKMPPWRLYNPFIDWRSSTTNLWIVSSIEIIILSFAIVQQLLMDVFNVIYCLLLRVHLKNLRKRVQQFRTDPEETEQESYDELTKCITQHKLILEYADLVRLLFSFNTFVQFILIGAILGCTLVNLFFFADFWIGLLCVVYIFGLMSQTFPFCYVCDLIINDCDRLALALFHSNWTGSSRRYKSTLIQFIHNAQQPITFTAGSIFPICMQTNIKVIKF